MNGTTIIFEQPDGVRRAITKIVPISDGFSVFVPYHTANSCLLMMMARDYSKGLQTIAFNDMVCKVATNQVKLSVHFPGFVQFSGVISQLIVSGKDPKTDKPRGMGVANDSPFSIRTGPVAAVAFWGLDEFKLAQNKRGMIFDDGRATVRVSEQTGLQYMLEIWMVHRSEAAVADCGGRPTAVIWRSQFDGLHRPIHLDVIDLPGVDHFLGLELIKIRSERDHDPDAFFSPSGFQLSGPAAGNKWGVMWGLNALFPIPTQFTDNVPSLDRVPPSP